MDRLRRLGSPGVHLGMWAATQRAYAFYLRLGFHELARSDPRTTATSTWGNDYEARLRLRATAYGRQALAYGPTISFGCHGTSEAPGRDATLVA